MAGAPVAAELSNWVSCDECGKRATLFQAGMNYYRLVSGNLPLVSSEDRHFCSWDCLAEYAVSQRQPAGADGRGG